MTSLIFLLLLSQPPTGMICTGGGAEQKPPSEFQGPEGKGLYYGWRLNDEMPPTWGALGQLRDVPIYLLQGEKDGTAKGTKDKIEEAPKATYERLSGGKVESSVVKHEIIKGANHGQLGMKQFEVEKPDVLDWLMDLGPECPSEKRRKRR